VLQQVHYWLVNPHSVGKIIDGAKYVYNTYDDWQSMNFPFWSANTIGRIFRSLEEMELLISQQPGQYDRKKYYTINYDHPLLHGPHDTKLVRSKGPDWGGRSDQDDTLNTETTAETTAEIIPEPKTAQEESSAKSDDWPDDWAAQAIEILTDDEDDDDFVEEVQYVKDPFGNDEDVDKPIVPKWRDPLNYNWQYDELMLAGLKACGRKKFGTKKEWSAWRDIDKTMIPLGLIPKEENKYPLEWIVFAIDWAAKKNKTNVTGQGNFAVRIKFPALLSLIKNEAKKNDFIRQWLDSDSVEEMEKNITVEAVTENPFADRL